MGVGFRRVTQVRPGPVPGLPIPGYPHGFANPWHALVLALEEEMNIYEEGSDEEKDDNAFGWENAYEQEV